MKFIQKNWKLSIIIIMFTLTKTYYLQKNIEIEFKTAVKRHHFTFGSSFTLLNFTFEYFIKIFKVFYNINEITDCCLH